MADLKLVKAALIPMKGDKPEPDTKKHIVVQFNPDTLKVSLSNSIRADSGAKASSSAVQYIDKSESSLSVTLVFDTSVARQSDQQMSNAQHSANSDVRLLTKAIATEFMLPQGEGDNPKAPKVCRFQWGAFAFVGVLSRFDENLEFFSPEGIPLRSTLSLSFKENRYQFETLSVKAQARATPNFFKGSEKGVAQSLADQGKDPRDWREIALLNAIENPRLLHPNNLAKVALKSAISPLLSPTSSLVKKAKDPLDSLSDLSQSRTSVGSAGDSSVKYISG